MLTDTKNVFLFWVDFRLLSCLRLCFLKRGLPLACENIRFSSLFAAGDVSRETSPAAKSEEKRMFS